MIPDGITPEQALELLISGDRSATHNFLMAWGNFLIVMDDARNDPTFPDLPFHLGRAWGRLEEMLWFLGDDNARESLKTQDIPALEEVLKIRDKIQKTLVLDWTEGNGYQRLLTQLMAVDWPDPEGHAEFIIRRFGSLGVYGDANALEC